LEDKAPSSEHPLGVGAGQMTRMEPTLKLVKLPPPDLDPKSPLMLVLGVNQSSEPPKPTNQSPRQLSLFPKTVYANTLASRMENERRGIRLTNQTKADESRQIQIEFEQEIKRDGCSSSVKTALRVHHSASTSRSRANSYCGSAMDARKELIVGPEGPEYIHQAPVTLEPSSEDDEELVTRCDEDLKKRKVRVGMCVCLVWTCGTLAGVLLEDDDENEQPPCCNCWLRTFRWCPCVKAKDVGD